MSDARELAESHPHKPWARRWLRAQGRSWYKSSEAQQHAAQKRERKQAFVKGAKVTK
jgi:hypothetical protein